MKHIFPKIIIPVLLLAFLQVPSSAQQDKIQEKVEREYRIKKREAPSEAVKWINDAYEGLKKVKWYSEKSNQGDSFEAKFRWKGALHSVEFNEPGVIQDIEVITKWETLPDKTRENLSNYFKSNFDKYTVKKTQTQYTGSPEDLEDFMDEDESEGIIIRYEIEFYGKNEQDNTLWEGLFDKRGHLIKIREVKMLPTRNMEY